jgi:hypothetical protein
VQNTNLEYFESFSAGSKLKVWVCLCRDGEIPDPHKVHLSPTDVDIDDLVQTAKTSTFEVELRNVSLLQIKVYQDAMCTKICANSEKLKDFSAGENSTSPFYIKVLSPGAATVLLVSTSLLCSLWSYACTTDGERMPSASESRHFAVCLCCCFGCECSTTNNVSQSLHAKFDCAHKCMYT